MIGLKKWKQPPDEQIDAWQEQADPREHQKYLDNLLRRYYYEGREGDEENNGEESEH